ncbi:GGDEF domain-containing protein [Caldimonas brevitalea]|uniref:diguanylate cyclase n=1 Tax=Caldimonas brevitalea TaxID=413882 RepID=A0A0G3BW72_9BURK|nr:GGDEF domain-containing protein [Caldimonas brevitalea]AKJ31636.1 diguanylate cyclase/phosphodiesterase [Caldimonas brevitalea]
MIPQPIDHDGAPPGRASRVGEEMLRRKGMRRFLVTVPSYAAVLLIVWAGAAVGLGPWQGAMVVTMFTLVTLSVFYGLLRSGLTLRSRDPVLTFAQVVFTILLVTLMYGLFDAGRTTALLWLSVTIAYDIRRLPERQIRLAAALSLLLPTLVVGLQSWFRPEAHGWRDDLLNLGLMAATLPVLIAVSAQARAVRRRELAQKEQMADTLAQLRELSVRDALTGAYNRRHMLARLDEEVRRQQRAPAPLCVVLLDIDHFKQVNDRCGHAVGDLVLCRLVQLAHEAFPGDVDVLARWGGEEFLLLMPGRDLEQVEAALQRLRDAVHAEPWAQLHDRLSVTFSAGLCQHPRGGSMTETLERADRALYQAKALGRDRLAVDASGGAAAPMRPAAPAPAVGVGPAPCPAPPLRPTAPATPADAVRATTGGRRPRRLLVDLLLGTERRMRAAMPMCWLSSGMYAACIAAMLLYVIPTGLLTAGQATALMAHNLIGCVVPLLLVRSGMTLRWRDPAMTLSYVLWSSLGLTAAYAWVPPARGAVLQMLTLTIVFGFMGLRPLQAKIAGAATVLLLIAMPLATAWSGAGDFEPRQTVLEVSMTSVVLWLLTMQSYNHGQTRDRVRREREELSAAAEQVERLMMRDPLTGLYNRQYMQLALERECLRHERLGGGFCVALIDLDHFKQINDRWGHQAGDHVLTGFASAAAGALRQTDVICRWGGEEFLVLLLHPGPDLERAGLAAVNRLREHVAAQRLCPGAPDLRVTLSAGVARHRPGELWSEVLARADRALYQAKAGGRDRCLLADAPAFATLPPGMTSSDAAARVSPTAT